MTSLAYVNVLLNVLIDYYFKNARCIFLIQDKLHRFEYNNEIPIVNINADGNYLNHSLIFQNYGCQNIFIYHENSSVIFNMFEAAILYNITKERYMNRRYVIVSTLTDMNKILALPKLEFVMDLLLINLESQVQKTSGFRDIVEETYRLFTHSFGGEKFNESLYLDTWNSNFGFIENRNLFPDKIKNANGRIFRLMTIPYQPNNVLCM